MTPPKIRIIQYALLVYAAGLVALGILGLRDYLDWDKAWMLGTALISTAIYYSLVVFLYLPRLVGSPQPVEAEAQPSKEAALLLAVSALLYLPFLSMVLISENVSPYRFEEWPRVGITFAVVLLILWFFMRSYTVNFPRPPAARNQPLTSRNSEAR